MNLRLETERNRANTAYRCAKEGIEKYGEKSSVQKPDEGDSHGEKYEAIVGRLPMRILNNGLGETIAFHFAKSKNKKGQETAHGYVCEQLRTWLVEQQYLRGSYDIASFVLDVVSLSVAESRVVTNETLAFLTWLRRFTDGLSAQMAASTSNSDSDDSSS
jgi:CRISPR-associated protein Cmr5